MKLETSFVEEGCLLAEIGMFKDRTSGWRGWNATGDGVQRECQKGALEGATNERGSLGGGLVI